MCEVESHASLDSNLRFASPDWSVFLVASWPCRFFGKFGFHPKKPTPRLVVVTVFAMVCLEEKAQQ